MTGPSDKALGAAARSVLGENANPAGQPLMTPEAYDAAVAYQVTRVRPVVEASYPIIRADVVVEVVAKLRELGHAETGEYGHSVQHAADAIEREFGA